MNAHTPGPWKFHKGRGIDPRFHVQTAGGFQVAQTPKNGIACGIEAVNEANAALIAAAPAMFAALESAHACLANLRAVLRLDKQDGDHVDELIDAENECAAALSHAKPPQK